MVSRQSIADETTGTREEMDPPAHPRASFAALRILMRSPLNTFGAVLVIGVVFLAIFGPDLAPFSPIKPDYNAFLSPPSSQHWFGTDEVGRDLFSRVLGGARISMEVALVVVGIGALAGTLLGLFSGYMGGWVDELLMRFTDVFLALPPLVLAIAIASTFGPSLGHTMLALTVLWWPWYARLIRGQILALREREYIEAARAAGVPPLRVMWRHLLPNTLAPLLVQISLDFGFAILAASSLSFIGLGVQQPEPDWGLMVADAQANIQSAWWVGIFPGLAIVLAVLGFNLVGDLVTDMLDPRFGA
jgi:peptide/nickel transport system permease protein